ncbi:hypothetical protein GWI33_016132 [Rhynchophorus ferrugineus]|uniref:Uncharacterized protein n=1 Tax=Rhynchophorus ferrugineus TaxID=354439 RepID=A0A834I0Q8_RHYFE|nr:hypothetical protein GWI33_016132 [Rhynchophorus ferrugineus]
MTAVTHPWNCRCGALHHQNKTLSKPQTPSQRKEKASGAETLAAIRGKLTRKELAGDGLKHVRVHRHGLVSLICKDQIRKRDLIEKISSECGIKIDNTEKRPKFRNTGVSREITDQQIIEDLIDQNEEIMNIIQEERKKTGNNEEPEELIKVVKKYICKNPDRNNVIIEAILEHKKVLETIR